jgi:hypothetical protein
VRAVISTKNQGLDGYHVAASSLLFSLACSVMIKANSSVEEGSTGSFQSLGSIVCHHEQPDRW